MNTSSSNDTSTLPNDSLNCLSLSLAFYINGAVCLCRALCHLPLSVIILRHGHQQWQQQQRSFASASHSDIFTYHMVVIQLLAIMGYLFTYIGTFLNRGIMTMYGFFWGSIGFYGEIYFNFLTCVERYLAIVHPITYQGLRNRRGIKVRNIGAGCVWFFSLCSTAISLLYYPGLPIDVFLFIISFLVLATSFCSFSALCTLFRPRPGDSGKHRQKTDQLQQRALYMMLTITGLLLVSILGLLIVTISSPINPQGTCLMFSVTGWLSLPSSVVLHFLYLHKKNKLSCCCQYDPEMK